MELSADNGYKLPALKVFSEAIKYLKNQFETDFKKHIPREDGTWDSWFDDILWVLTVPAIWSDQAKQFMREAAMQVKIYSNVTLLNDFLCLYFDEYISF